MLLFLVVVVSVYVQADEEICLDGPQLPQVPDEIYKTNDVSVALKAGLENIIQCQDQIWPNFKINKVPLYIVVGEKVIRFNEDKSKAEIMPDSFYEENKDSLKSTYGMLGDRASGIPYFRYFPPVEEQPHSSPAPKPPPNTVSDNSNVEMACIDLRPPPSGKGGPPRNMSESSLTTGFHEFFHLIEQNSQHVCHEGEHKWKQVDGGSGRSNPDQEIVIGRAHMIKYLKEAFLTKSPNLKREYLQKAKSWQKFLKTKYPNEMKQMLHLDIAEGTAEYAGIKSHYIFQNGCDLKNNNYDENIEKVFETRARTSEANATNQSYSLGFLAGVHLDKLENKNWKEKVMEGNSPIDVFFDSINVEDVPVVSEESVAKPIITENKYVQCMIDESLGPIKKALSSPDDYIAIAIPTNGRSTNYTAPPFQKIEELSDPHAMASGFASFSTEKISFEKWGTIAGVKACGEESYHIIFVPKSSIREVKGTISVNATDRYGAKVEGTFNYSSNNQSYEDISVYCP